MSGNPLRLPGKHQSFLHALNEDGKTVRAMDPLPGGIGGKSALEAGKEEDETKETNSKMMIMTSMMIRHDRIDAEDIILDEYLSNDETS
ncbi:hypothetical protein FQR65_LT19814 [Abscondita terminalis]|nr:hypothetical protein FQR65_LT19814 [Abscondita terminalis]